MDIDLTNLYDNSPDHSIEADLNETDLIKSMIENSTTKESDKEILVMHYQSI